MSAVCEFPKRATIRNIPCGSHKCAPTDIKLVDFFPEHQVAEHLLGGLFQNKVDAK